MAAQGLHADPPGGAAGAGSQHRAGAGRRRPSPAALEATAFLIDWLKTDAPFWKREEFADGSAAWVEAREATRTRRALERGV